MPRRPQPRAADDPVEEIVLKVGDDEYRMRLGPGDRTAISPGSDAVSEIGEGGTYFAGDRSRARLEGHHLQVVAQVEPELVGDKRRAIRLAMEPRQFDGRRRVYDYRIELLPRTEQGASHGDLRIEPLDAKTSAFRNMDQRSARLKLAELSKPPRKSA
jgi:hypothetical protein